MECATEVREGIEDIASDGYDFGTRSDGPIVEILSDNVENSGFMDDRVTRHRTRYGGQYRLKAMWTGKRR